MKTRFFGVPSAPKAYRGRFTRRFGMVVLLVASFVGAWLAGTRRKNTSTRYTVGGVSMVPTLYPESLEVACRNCRAALIIGKISGADPNGDLICDHCGEILDANWLKEPANALKRPGQMVEVLPGNEDIRLGDLVAVEKATGGLEIKRVAAVGGDHIHEVAGELFLNGKPIADAMARAGTEIPRILVDDSEFNQSRRWLPIRAQNENERSRWYRYHHDSVHDHGRSSAVLDHYTFNHGLTRRLYPATRLSVELHLDCDSDGEIEVAIWGPKQSRLVTTEFTQGTKRIDGSYLKGIPQPDLPVNAQHPIAFRVTRGKTLITRRQVYRWIRYRLRPRDPRNQYPLQLAKDELFLLGDNTPVSIDGRTTGPVVVNRVVGHVRHLEFRTGFNE